MSKRTQEQTCSRTPRTSTLPFPGSDLTPSPPLPPSSEALTCHPDALGCFPSHLGCKSASLSFIFLSTSITGTCTVVVTLLLGPVVTMTLELGGHQCSCSWNTEPAVEWHWSRKHSTEAAVGTPGPSEVTLRCRGDPNPTHRLSRCCLPPQCPLPHCDTHSILKHCSRHLPPFASSSSLLSSCQPPLPTLA